MKLLIKDTTRAEREAIVAASLEGTEGCDECSQGLIEMYQDYIDGKKELCEIHRDFHPNYVVGEDVSPSSGCERY